MSYDNQHDYDQSFRAQFELALQAEAEREQRIKELREEKARLLDVFGIFGGGEYAHTAHRRINEELESLGVDPNS